MEICAERIQRIVQAIILGFIFLLAGLHMLKAAFLLMLAMMVMLLIAGFTGFCPGLIVLKKVFPPCKCDEEKE